MEAMPDLDSLCPFPALRQPPKHTSRNTIHHQSSIAVDFPVVLYISTSSTLSNVPNAAATARAGLCCSRALRIDNRGNQHLYTFGSAKYTAYFSLPLGSSGGTLPDHRYAEKGIVPS